MMPFQAVTSDILKEMHAFPNMGEFILRHDGPVNTANVCNFIKVN